MWAILSHSLTLLNHELQLELIRFVAAAKPMVAAAKVCERSMTIIKSLFLAPYPAQVGSWTIVLNL